MKKQCDNTTSKKNNMGISIAFGAGVGIVFGDVLFNDVGLGLVIGAGLGASLGGIFTHTSKKNNDDAK